MWTWYLQGHQEDHLDGLQTDGGLGWGLLWAWCPWRWPSHRYRTRGNLWEHSCSFPHFFATRGLSWHNKGQTWARGLQCAAEGDWQPLRPGWTDRANTWRLLHWPIILGQDKDVRCVAAITVNLRNYEQLTVKSGKIRNSWVRPRITLRSELVVRHRRTRRAHRRAAGRRWRRARALGLLAVWRGSELWNDTRVRRCRGCRHRLWSPEINSEQLDDPCPSTHSFRSTQRLLCISDAACRNMH